MDLNYTAFALISFIPLLIGWFWYRKNSLVASALKMETTPKPQVGILKLLFLLVLSVAFVYAYMNVIIHQLGFYELFFTDIVLGDKGAEKIVSDFMQEYGAKHRHFGHGIFHGAINSFVLVLPIIAAFTIIEKRSFKYLLYHFLYWLLTSMIIGGLISEFV